jgi:hypothetical protein
MKVARILTVAAATLVTTVAASAQSFNINFGTTATPLINSTYGAAAGQAGNWNQVTNSAVVNQALVNIAGGASAATLSLDGGTMFYFPTAVPNGVTTSGDAQSLLDSLWDTGGPGLITINGLAPGVYDFYIYAIAPDSNTAITTINLNGLGVQNVGGQLPNPFNDQYAVGLTHALYQNVNIAGGASVVVNFSAVFASVNGMQIRLVPAPGALALLGVAGLVGTRRRRN